MIKTGAMRFWYDEHEELLRRAHTCGISTISIVHELMAALEEHLDNAHDEIAEAAKAQQLFQNGPENAFEEGRVYGLGTALSLVETEECDLHTSSGGNAKASACLDRIATAIEQAAMVVSSEYDEPERLEKTICRGQGGEGQTRIPKKSHNGRLKTTVLAAVPPGGIFKADAIRLLADAGENDNSVRNTIKRLIRDSELFEFPAGKLTREKPPT